jgi:hypothetical protein
MVRRLKATGNRQQATGNRQQLRATPIPRLLEGVPEGQGSRDGVHTVSTAVPKGQKRTKGN